MAKILSIDYGTKRTGIAATDDLQMMAFGLTAIPTETVLDFLQKYVQTEKVETIVVGLPTNLQGTTNELETEILSFIEKCKNILPNLPIERLDERFTSKLAEQSILFSGKKKSDRQNKFLVDEVSATILLQDYLEKRKRTT